MALNIFEKYGIKEVANVYFEALEDDIKAGVYKGDIVLFLDTLKVSTIETSAESTDARGGWGNPKLVSWDYGKEITVTLEDALMSLESLRFMLGGAIHRSTSAEEKVIVRHTEEVVAEDVGGTIKLPAPKDHLTGKVLLPSATEGHPIRLINLGGNNDENNITAGTRCQIETGTWKADVEGVAQNKVKFYNPAAGVVGQGNVAVAPLAGDHIRIFWDEILDSNSTAEQAVEVTISPDTFPGTYKIVGDTFMRSEKTGKDEAFQFIIGKAKVSSSVTLTLQAEGDPATFSMDLNVLRSSNERGENEMMKLVRYTFSSEATSGSTGKDIGSLENGST